MLGFVWGVLTGKIYRWHGEWWTWSNETYRPGPSYTDVVETTMAMRAKEERCRLATT